MKRLVFAFLSASITLFGTIEELLPTTSISTHFILHHKGEDAKLVKKVLNHAEANYQNISQIFEHKFFDTIHIEVYPDIQTFHDAIHKPEAPPWVVGGCNIKRNAILMVSPNNPGSCHSYTSMMSVLIVDLAMLFIHDQYEYSKIPRWLYLGTSLYITKHQPKKQWFTNRNFPSFTALTESTIEEFGSMGGFQYSWSLIDFIVSKWGWDSILNLLEEPNDFKKSLGIGEKQLHYQWEEYVHDKYEFAPKNL